MSAAQACRAALLVALALLTAAPAKAIERIRLVAESASVAGVEARDVQAELRIRSARSSVLTARAASLELPPALRAQFGRITDLRLTCEEPVVREPRIACPLLVADARAPRLPPLHVETSVEADTRTSRIVMQGSGPTLEGALVQFTFTGTPQDWQAQASVPRLQLSQIAALVRPWVQQVPETVPAGSSAMIVEAAAASDRPLVASVTADLADLAFSNDEGTVVLDAVGGRFRATVTPGEPAPARIELQVDRGQLLAGPVFFDLGANRFSAVAEVATPGEGVIPVTALRFDQPGIARVAGHARIRTEPFAVENADLQILDLRFPGAYASLMQIALTTTPFARLATTGRASGAVRIANNAPTAVDLVLEDIAAVDAAQQLELRGLDGEVHWTQDQVGPPRPSYLAWETARGWGITGGAARIDFTTSERDFRLIRPTRLPLWDGALQIDRLEALDIGSGQLSGGFDATIEPIGLEQVTRALGWPAFGGQVSGRIPGLDYRDGVLTVRGDLEAQVFDGRITARNLRIREPFSAWPRIHGDVTARNLDLELLTRTFEFGTITGRLDGDLLGLETFGWTPVAFDLRLATPADDRSRHRISQRAVRNLSSIAGGGAGSVAAALQGGVLRFFENFRYERIGITCRLENDVCDMGGVEPARDGGYYIVKGSGLPRIDIIGNQGRVDWPRLVAQVANALENAGEIVVD